MNDTISLELTTLEAETLLAAAEYAVQEGDDVDGLASSEAINAITSARAKLEEGLAEALDPENHELHAKSVESKGEAA